MTAKPGIVIGLLLVALAGAMEDPASLSTRDQVALLRIHEAEFVEACRWAVVRPDQPAPP